MLTKWRCPGNDGNGSVNEVERFSAAATKRFAEKALR